MTASDTSYSLVENWEQLPKGLQHLDCVGVGIDAHDRVYVLTRNDARVIVYQPDGRFVCTWGEGLFTPRAHSIRIGPDGCVYITDDGAHTVRKFSPEGQLLLTLGSGVPSNSGYVQAEGLSSITHGGPPFNRPTGVAVAPGGDIYVSDGYGNARVHRFDADGQLIGSWGEPGSQPGQFRLPHDVCIRPDGTVMVADRENDRIQFFSPEGKFLKQWTQVQRPTGLALDRQGNLYVSELWWRVGQHSYRHGPILEDQPGRVSVLSPEGQVLARWGGPDRTAPGMFIAPHGIGVDSKNDLYVAEVSYSFAGKNGLVPVPSQTLQKFTPKQS